jgi:endonuclease YncB( thermonuclease family)
LAGAALCALAACGDGAGLDRLAAGPREAAAEVRSGDLIVLRSGLVVRLAGVETPRWGEPGAAAAEDDLRRLVEGRDVELYYGGARKDPYGRTLAQVRLADGRRWVQCALLRDGVALVHTYADNRAMARPMLTCEAQARRGRRGLWSAAISPVRLPSEIGDRATGFTIVEGRVSRVTPAYAGTYLDFEGARNGFAVQVAGRAAPDLRAAGVSPASLTGHWIRVRGTIGGDGVMRVDHPEQIERLKDR